MSCLKCILLSFCKLLIERQFVIKLSMIIFFYLLLTSLLFPSDTTTVRTVTFPFVMYNSTGYPEKRDITIANQGTIAEMFQAALSLVKNYQSIAFRSGEKLTYRVYIGGNAYQRVVYVVADVNRTFSMVRQDVQCLERELGQSVEWQPVGSPCYKRWDQWRAIGGQLPKTI